MVSVRLSPLLKPLRAPPFAAETGNNQWMMVAMAVTVRCAVMVGEGGARTFLPVLFLQLQPRHCPFALHHGNGGEAGNHVHFALDTPENHKNRIFFEKTS